MSRSAAAAAGFLVTSCVGERLSTSPEPRPTFTSTPPEKLATRWPVDRVVYLMLENRSFDNIFGRYPGAAGTRTGMRWGEEVGLRHCPEWLPGDLPHDTASWHAMHNDGKMDGFAIGEYGPYFAYSQFDRPDVKLLVSRRYV
jgi:phospholipase C